MKMQNQSFFLKLISRLLIFIYLTQGVFIPSVYAQRGIFVRESEMTKDDNGKSFRTNIPEEDPASLGAQIPGGLSGKAGAGSVDSLSQQKNSNDPLGSTSSLSGAAMSYQVNILGEVKRPGTYRIPPSTRVSEVLQLAGGIRKNGSERYVEIRRPGGAGRKIDLMAYKMMGKLEENPYLMDNEVIFVPIRQKVIEVEGALNRPGIYELRGEKTLADALRLGGGFTQGVSRKDPIRIIRYEDEKKNIIEVKNEALEIKNFVLNNGDVIVVPHMFTTENKFDYNLRKLPNDNLFYPSFEDRVFVIGAVEVPGAYNFNQYYKLNNYLALAGGLNRMAKKSVKLIDPEGNVKKLKPDNTDILINPGDTIYVQEKALSRETWISLLSTIAGLGLSVANTAIVLSK